MLQLASMGPLAFLAVLKVVAAVAAVAADLVEILALPLLPLAENKQKIKNNEHPLTFLSFFIFLINPFVIHHHRSINNNIFCLGNIIFSTQTQHLLYIITCRCF
jgi:hypothetical protein